MLKKLLLLSVWVFWPSYCYSDSLAPWWGITGNAITDQSMAWAMNGILPDGTPGAEIQNVIYSYKIQKETGEWVTVFVQNENVAADGYIFRSRDDWMPGSLAGTQINKVVAAGNLPRELWGDGSIEVQGNGSVYDANVVYTFKVTPCFDPQFDVNCPGYVRPMPDIPIYEVGLDDIYNVFDDDSVDLERNTTLTQDDDNLESKRKDDEEEEEEKKRKYRLEKAMSIGDAAAMFAENQTIAQMNESSQRAITRAYISKDIPGKEYVDANTLVDTQLPDAPSGLRNGLAQQLLHNKMVEMQYNLNTN